MNKQLYDIPDIRSLEEIRAWAADPENRSSLITVGVEPNVRYQLVVYDLPAGEPNVARAEAYLGTLIKACEWPE